MNYELAKQLKDAGFEMSEDCQCDNGEPTLSELIDACGDGFGELCKVEKGRYVNPKNLKELLNIEWEAYPTAEEFNKHSDCEVGCCGMELGKTPEEAVAKLWLELNK